MVRAPRLPEAFGQPSQAQGETIGVSVHGQKLGLMIPVGAFQLWVFCDSVLETE